MISKFMFNNIKNIDLIYLREKVGVENSTLTYINETYCGLDYCKSIINKLQARFSEIKDVKYRGQTKRIACEEFEITTVLAKYSISYTIDTFQEKTQTQFGVCILSLGQSKEYDIFLEKIKIFLKEILLQEWETCTWIVDEQSEYLGMQLYPLIYKTENKMRAFVNSVLTYRFGTKWMNQIGFEDIVKGYKRSAVDFKREVPEFNNINDSLICATVESLTNLMMNSKVYDPTISLSDEDSKKIHEKIADNNINAVYNIILENRKTKIDIWEHVFKKYFKNGESVRKGIDYFIKNRNHIAHNKLLTKASYNKMKENIAFVKLLFEDAEKVFIDEDPSDELSETWDVEQERREFEIEYLYDRIKSETGIDILSRKNIFSMFEDKIQELYDEIDNVEYFNYAVTIGQLNCIDYNLDRQVLFTVNSNVREEFSFSVCASLDVADGMGEDSYLRIWVEKYDASKILETEITYHNGEAHEDSMECCFIPDDDSFFDDRGLRDFTNDLKVYINDEMNPLKNEAEALSIIAAKEGGTSVVASFTCWNCGREYISLENDLYPYGKCINCGEENEILVCRRCETIYPSDEGGKFGELDMCNYCLEKLEEE